MAWSLDLLIPQMMGNFHLLKSKPIKRNILLNTSCPHISLQQDMCPLAENIMENTLILYVIISHEKPNTY